MGGKKYYTHGSIGIAPKPAKPALLLLLLMLLPVLLVARHATRAKYVTA